VLVHVSDPGNPVTVPEGRWVEEAGNMIEEQMEATGIALRAEGFSAEAINAYGSVKREIETLAERHRADLVILGTHGRRGLSRLLFGSEAEGLMRYSDRPVLAVGPSARQASPEAWAPTNILCATGLRPGAAKVVIYGYKLAQSVGAGFALLSVDDPDHSSDDDQTWTVFEEALAKELPEEDIGRCQIRSLLSGKGPAAKIIDVARTLKPDLIVMGAKASNFSSTHLPAGVLAQVLADAPCPVLTISID